LDIDENADFDFVWDLREMEMNGIRWNEPENDWYIVICMKIGLKVREMKTERMVCSDLQMNSIFN
jgi:hypothetical protein